MTRGEFVNQLIKASSIDLGGKDVTGYLTSNGILVGDSKGNLIFDQPITYNQIATILSRFYGLSKLDAHQINGPQYVYALEERFLPKDAVLSDKVAKGTITMNMKLAFGFSGDVHII